MKQKLFPGSRTAALIKCSALIRFLACNAALMICLGAVTVSEAGENSTELYNRGVKLVREGKLDEALEQFNRAAKISPYYALAYYGIGRVYMQKNGEIDKAVKNLEKSVYLDSKFSRGYFYLGLALMFSGKYPQAIHAFDNARRYDKTLIEALYNIAIVYDLMDAKSKSRLYFEKYKKEKKKLKQQMERRDDLYKDLPGFE